MGGQVFSYRTERTPNRGALVGASLASSFSDISKLLFEMQQQRDKMKLGQGELDNRAQAILAQWGEIAAKAKAGDARAAAKLEAAQTKAAFDERMKKEDRQHDAEMVKLRAGLEASQKAGAETLKGFGGKDRTARITEDIGLVQAGKPAKYHIGANLKQLERMFKKETAISPMLGLNIAGLDLGASAPDTTTPTESPPSSGVLPSGRAYNIR